MHNGRRPSSRPTEKRELRAPIPPTIASAVPSVGTSAYAPGNGVPFEKRAAEHAIAAIPAHPSTSRTGDGVRSSVVAATASAAPSPSSQARVNGEKYAIVGAVLVWWIDHASEAPASTVTTHSSRRRLRARNSASDSTSGQTR